VKTKISKTTKTSKKSRSIEIDQIFGHKPQVIFREEEKHVSIISLDDPKNFYQINNWAAELFKAVDGKTPVGAIFKKIQEASQLSEELVQQKAQKVLQDLLKADLIERK
jgi:hypothetical protein